MSSEKTQSGPIAPTKLSLNFSETKYFDLVLCAIEEVHFPQKIIGRGLNLVFFGFEREQFYRTRPERARRFRVGLGGWGAGMGLYPLAIPKFNVCWYLSFKISYLIWELYFLAQISQLRIHFPVEMFHSIIFRQKVLLSYQALIVFSNIYILILLLNYLNQGLSTYL